MNSKQKGWGNRKDPQTDIGGNYWRGNSCQGEVRHVTSRCGVRVALKRLRTLRKILGPSKLPHINTHTLTTHTDLPQLFCP